MPLFSVPMISRPMKVPSMLPEPPDRLAPPITTTAMTFSRSAVPAVGWAESSWDPISMPARDASTLAVM